MSIQLPPGCARRYRLERPLSEGGFGAVVLATQLAMDRLVAIKLLHADLLEQAEHVQRFQDEARITAQIVHPHVVTLLDFDVEDGVPWIVYEYLAGPTLHAALAGGPLAWPDAARVTAQVLAALAAAHEQGVLHRDIKPHNVMEAGPRHYKVTDFGIARWSGSRAVKTRTGVLVGTPAYVAPELVQAGAASPASDLYAVGVMLFEMLAGRPPFVDASPIAVLQKHVLEAPPDVAALAPGAPLALTELARALLAKEPERRPASAEAAREVLVPLLAAVDAGRPARVRTGRSAALAGAATHVAPAPRRAATQRGAMPALAAALGAALVAAVAGSRSTPRAPASPAPAVTAAPAGTAPAGAASGALAADYSRRIGLFVQRKFDLWEREKGNRAHPTRFGMLGYMLVRAVSPADMFSGEPAVSLDDVEGSARWFVSACTPMAREVARLDEEATAALAPSGDFPAWLVIARIRAERFARESDLDHVTALQRAVPELRKSGDLGQVGEGIVARIPYPARTWRGLESYRDAAIRAAQALAAHSDGAGNDTAGLFDDLAQVAMKFEQYGIERSSRDEVLARMRESFIAGLRDLEGERGGLVRDAVLDAWDVGTKGRRVTPPFKASAGQRLLRLGGLLPPSATPGLKQFALEYYGVR